MISKDTVQYIHIQEQNNHSHIHSLPNTHPHTQKHSLHGWGSFEYIIASESARAHPEPPELRITSCLCATATQSL
jgi:hypothetical protein